jgi:RNA polymerase sigma factor (sigma-70 family)
MANGPDRPLEPIDPVDAAKRAAANELFVRAYPRLLQLAKRMLRTFPDVRRQHSSESLPNEAWIDFQAALKTIEPNGQSVYPLVARKMRFVLLDVAAKERKRLDTLPLTPEETDRVTGSSCDPGRMEIWTRFHEAVDALPEDVREAFLVYFYTDEKPNQTRVAEALGIDPRQARRLIARAKTLLAARVTGLGDVLGSR